MSTEGTFLDPKVVALLDEAAKLYGEAAEKFREASAVEDAAREIVKKNGHPHVQSNGGIPDQERKRRAVSEPWGQWGTPRPEIVEGTFG